MGDVGAPRAALDLDRSRRLTLFQRVAEAKPRSPTDLTSRWQSVGQRARSLTAARGSASAPRSGLARRLVRNEGLPESQTGLRSASRDESAGRVCGRAGERGVAQITASASDRQTPAIRPWPDHANRTTARRPTTRL